jgi:hypothetical protein
MSNIGKEFSLLLIVFLAVSNLINIESASAQTMHKPSVPEFTLKLIDNSYDVAPTTKVNPYTGKTETSRGYHVKCDPEIDIIIKNQPFTGLYYQVQTKGHFSQDWRTIGGWRMEAGDNIENQYNQYQRQNYSDQYTILRYDYNGNLPSEGQMDFQVEALIGSVTVGGDSDHSALYNIFYPTYTFSGVTSGWSDTQTISISSFPFDIISLLVIAFIIIATVSAVAIVVLLHFRKHPKVPPPP